MKKLLFAIAATALCACLLACGQSPAPAPSDGGSEGAAPEAMVGIVMVRDGQGCLQCHGAEDYRALPADPAGRTADMCMSCHGTSYLNNPSGAPHIPHNLTDPDEPAWVNE